MSARHVLYLVGCGQSKADEPREAQHLYTSSYFTVKSEAAQELGDDWRILSAQHGVVMPETELEPYDTSINDLEDQELDSFREQIRRELHRWVGGYCRDVADDGSAVVELRILLGQDYHRKIQPVLEDLKRERAGNLRTRNPFAEMDANGNGEQMQQLRLQIQGGEPA